MKNSKLFQYIFIGAFIFFIIVGAIMFSTYRSSTSTVKQINVTIWGTLPADSFTAFVSRYLNESNLKYNIQYLEKDSSTFDQSLVEALASGNGPDAIILPQELITRYTNKIYTIPYTILSELQFKQTYVQEGELYLNSSGILALPFSVDPLVMYWNRDIFNNVSVTKPPVNWSEVSSLVPKITTKDGAKNITRSTTALGEFRNISNAKDIMSALLIQAGNPIVVSSEGGDLSSSLRNDFGQKTSPAILSLGFYSNFSNPSRNEYSWNRSLPNSLDAFTNGDLAIYFGFSSEYMTIKNKNPNLNFDVSLLPQAVGAKTYSTFGKMLGFAILRSSLDPAGTYTVISTLTSGAAFPYWTNIFNIPSARRDVLSYPDKSAIKTIFNNSAIMSKGWLDPNKLQTSAIFQEMIESYTTGRETLDGAVGTASDRLNSLLGNN